MAGLYFFANGPSPTTAAQLPVTTGTAIKTLLQIKPPASGSGQRIKIVEWGISFDGSAAATPIKCELCQTDVAATVTAAVLADIPNLDPAGGTSTVAVGVSATGYTSAAEGTITAVRMFDAQLVAPTGAYVKQFPLGREPIVDFGKFLRIRVTAPVAVNALAYCVFEE